MPLLICGTGPGTKLLVQSSGGGNLFDISDSAGVTFQDLFVEYDHTFSVDGTAFSFSAGSGHSLFRIKVLNCRYPAAFSGTSHVRMLGCFFDYANNKLASLSDVKAVQITGASKDTTISQCTFSWSVGDAASTDYGIFIDQLSGLKVNDTQVAGFGTGIQIQASSAATTDVRFIASRADAYGSCVVINSKVYDVSFVDCHFQASESYLGTAIGSAGIAVGTDPGTTNSQIDTIRFTSCSLTGNAELSSAGGKYGLEIGAGQNIQILGGDYSGNGATAGISIVGGAIEVQIVGANCIGLEFEGGKDATPLYQLYGIEITDGADIQIIGVNCSGNGNPMTPGDGIHIDGTGAIVSNVRIVGAICAGPVFGSSSIQQNTGIYVKSAQELVVKDCTLIGSATSIGYGLYLESVSDVTVRACDLYDNTVGLGIEGSAGNVFVRDCNASGYSSYTSAIAVAAALVGIEITNCAGYNDRHQPLSSTPPSGTFTAITVANYYGPAVFYATNAFNVTIDGQMTRLGSGGFTLAPGETAAFPSGVTPTFVMIGN